MFFHIWLTLIWMPKLCSQNPYTAVTIDLIYPLMIFISSWFLIRKTCLRNSLFKCLVNPFVLLSVILSLKNISAKKHYKHYGRIPVNLVHHLYYKFLQLAYVAYLRTPTPIFFVLIAEQKILQFDWMRDTTCHTQPKSSSLRCYLPLMTISMQKLGSLDSFHRYWRSKNPAIWLDKRQNWPHPTKIGSLRC